MDILIQLAGVQLGPYSEEQIRKHLSEGLLSATDPAKHEGMEDWAPLNEVLAHLLPPDETPQEPAPDEVSEAPKRAPSAPPGVTHLPARQQDSSTLARKSALIGPTAPTIPSSSGQGVAPIVTTSPLGSAQEGTKKMGRASLIKTLAQKTAPLPTKSLVSPIKGPPSRANVPLPPQQDARQESLIRSLTAKTVPIRSAPVPPASPPSTLPITAPLPTKPEFKPASGTVPSPSVVKAMTQKLGPAELPDSAQPSSPAAEFRDPEEEEAKILPRPETIDGKKTEGLIPVEPVDESSKPTPSRRFLPGLIYACAALAVLALYYVWSPYHAAASLRSALDDGDPDELAAAIDFPSVRASLEGQIAQSSPAGAASSDVLSMMDRSIDLYVTPNGIAGLIKRPDQFSKKDQAQTVTPEVAAKLFLAFNGLPVRNEGLASLRDFVLDRDAAMLHLQFQGMGWKLKRIDLRPNLLLTGPSGSAAPALSPVVDTYLDRGDAESKQSDWKDAIADFTEVLAINPQSSAAYNDRGGARQSKGDLDGAISDYTKALEIDPQMAAAYHGRGNIKAAKNDLDGAIADFTKAVRIDPTMAVAYDSRGNARTAKGDLDGAIADFTQAITIDPNLAGAYSDRGFARQANGNFDGAISDYTQALVLKPKTASSYYNRGLARLSQGNSDAAIVDFDRALAFDPKIAEAYYYRGNAKSATRDLDGAIADFTQAVALSPKIAMAYCNRGLARQAKGDIAGAFTDYTQALAIDPKIAIAYYNRGLIETQENDPDGAIADSSQALYLDLKNAQAYYIRGFAKLAKGNLDGALADLNQFCDLAPRDHDADHARLYLWLIAKAQNAKTDPDQELSDALTNNWNSSADEMISKTASFLLGRVTETDYLAGAASPDAKTDQGQHCQAWYFTGMKRLLTGDRKGALDVFHQCLATGQKDAYEYMLAQGELQVLEAAPAVPAPPAAHATVAPAAKNPPVKGP